MTKFKELLEGLDENTRVTIQEAWDAQITEAREAVTAELREEFAQRYEHDKKQITEAVEKFVSTKIAEEIAELVEDKKKLAQERVTYRKAIDEHAKVLDKFVVEQVAKEVRELHADRKRVKEHVGKLDDFVTESLAGELTEFHEDKKTLAEQRVKMLREGKASLVKAKKDFIRKAAALVEKTINKSVTSEIQTLREDITRARENDFGRRLFETFVGEFRSSYLNDSKEMKVLQKQIATLNLDLKESKKEADAVKEAHKLTESKMRIAQDKYQRKEKLNSLLRPLAGEKREIMSDLLESVKTAKLDEAFKKYLPSVLKTEGTRSKIALKESVVTEHTGNRNVSAKAGADVESAEIVDLQEMKKLAGLLN